MTEKRIFLKDYTPCDFVTGSIHLTFELDADSTRVTSVQQIRRVNPHARELVLNGEDLETGSICINGKTLGDGEYEITGKHLVIPDFPGEAELVVTNFIRPEKNTRLEGLYVSGPHLCTQCEPEGFSRITWFLDRPDHLCLWRVKLIADPVKYPVLLSNGHQVASGILPDGRHFAEWEDPFFKPAYLFALVAGDLVSLEKVRQTCSGRSVTCRIWVEPHNRERCHHALESLLAAMQWDEKVFHRECDLDLYQIVAVDAFNAGAMENKGLNIFNSKYVLASPGTATDSDYDNILRVVAHEYFHNWSGNRVTLRDWFQLSLKEGLTVFRDQEFTCDTLSRPVKRIDDVRLLRSSQFLEDAGPLAHPVRPESYVDINNFYTQTVYEKGAEIIRMLHTCVGHKNFVDGLDLYFARHDHGSATVEDLVACLGEAAGMDLSVFLRWYAQPGTPVIKAQWSQSPSGLDITLTQSNDKAPDAPPLPVPVVISCLDRNHGPVVFSNDEIVCTDESRFFALLLMEERERSFHLPVDTDIETVCWLAGFSAPVILKADSRPHLLLEQFAHAPDPVNRWDAGQELMHLLVELELSGSPSPLFDEFILAMQGLLHSGLEESFLARLLIWPDRALLCREFSGRFLLEDILETRKTLLRRTAERMAGDLEPIFLRYQRELPSGYDPDTSRKRALKNTLFTLLCSVATEHTRQMAVDLAENACNMTDRLAALSVLCQEKSRERDLQVAGFFSRFGHDFLMQNTWLTLQASAEAPDTFEKLRELENHPAFDLKNPNKVRALYGAFCTNLLHFHRADGAGYRLLGEVIEKVNDINSAMAARLVSPLSSFSLVDDGREQLMRQELSRLSGISGMKDEVLEQIHRSLGES